ALEDMQFKLAELARKRAPEDAFDELLAMMAILDQLRDRDHLEVEPLLELHELRNARHGAVVVEHFAKHAARPLAREEREIDRRLRVARSLEHAAGTGAQRKHVPRLHELIWMRLGVGEDADGQRAIIRADAGGDALGRIYADGEIRAVRLPVLLHHRPEA